MSKTKVIWTIKELTSILRQRQLNQFDCNIGVSGKRGDGKSTFLFKIFNSFKNDGFSQEKHQVYAQDDVIKLLANQKFGFCWDDEAINSGYKRDFQSTGQKTLIKVVTNYRDNYNIYASALPFFYNLDKDLRELIFMHIHIIERGVAVILLPLTDQIHSSDPWDTDTNKKIEKKEYERMKRSPGIPFRYHRFTTFAGYIYFGDMTDKQRKKYKQIKSKRRARTFGVEGTGIDNINKTFNQKLLDLLLDGKITKDGMIQMCLMEGKKHSSIVSAINRMLKDIGDTRSISQLYRETDITSSINKNKSGINDLIPDI